MKSTRILIGILSAAVAAAVLYANGGIEKFPELIQSREPIGHILQGALALFVLNLLIVMVLKLIFSIVERVAIFCAYAVAAVAIGTLLLTAGYCWITEMPFSQAYNNIAGYLASLK